MSIIWEFNLRNISFTDDKDFNTVKAILCDTKNNYFSNEKFLMSLSDEGQFTI